MDKLVSGRKLGAMKPAFAVVLLSAMALSGWASADVGPKPSIDVRFNFDKPGITLVSGQLYECMTASCKVSSPLRALGPQRFECDTSRCGGEAYGFTDYVWIKVVLSDGRTLRSRPFAKHDFDAAYKAKVQGRRLEIEPVKG
jgi:hypothetical protein